MDERSRAVGMLEPGKTQRHVSERFHVSQSVISRLWNRYLQAGNCQRRQKSRRSRCTTVREDRYLAIVAKRQRFQSAVKLNAEFQRATGSRISTQTVRNRFTRQILKSLSTSRTPRIKIAASQKSPTVGNGTQKLATTSLALCSFLRRVAILC